MHSSKIDLEHRFSMSHDRCGNPSEVGQIGQHDRVRHPSMEGIDDLVHVRPTYKDILLAKQGSEAAIKRIEIVEFKDLPQSTLVADYASRSCRAGRWKTDPEGNVLFGTGQGGCNA